MKEIFFCIRADRRYKAVKVLSRDATADCLTHKQMLEIEIMQKVKSLGKFDALPQLLDIFPIVHDQQTIHMAMVMEVLGTDIGSFRRLSPKKTLPLYTVRIIMRQVVEGLVHLHSAGIVHTGICISVAMLHVPLTDV